MDSVLFVFVEWEFFEVKCGRFLVVVDNVKVLLIILNGCKFKFGKVVFVIIGNICKWNFF